MKFMNIKEREFSFVFREHIYVWVIDNSNGQIADAPVVTKLLEIHIDNYTPGENEEFDVDKFEERQGYIYAPAARKFWKQAWGLARTFVKHGQAQLPNMGVSCPINSIVVLS